MLPNTARKTNVLEETVIQNDRKKTYFFQGDKKIKVFLFLFSFLTLSKKIAKCLRIRILCPSVRALIRVNIIRLHEIHKCYWASLWYVWYWKRNISHLRFIHRDVQKDLITLRLMGRNYYRMVLSFFFNTLQQN